MKRKNYSAWLKGHVRLAQEILPQLPKTFHNKRGLYTLVFDRGRKNHVVAYYTSGNETPLHEERDESLSVATERMLVWYKSFVESRDKAKSE